MVTALAGSPRRLRHLVSGPAFLDVTPNGRALGLDRQPISHLVKPAGNRIPPAQRGRLFQQHEKSSLEDIVGIVRIVQRAPADP